MDAEVRRQEQMRQERVERDRAILEPHLGGSGYGYISGAIGSAIY